MVFLLSSKLRGELLRQQISFSPTDSFLVLPVCTMPQYVSDEVGWNKYFGRGGILRQKITSALQQAGANMELVDFYCYLTGEQVVLSDYSCLIVPGGDVELGLSRLVASGLDKQLADFQGVVIAYSAGALLLLKRFFLSPNYYYSSFITQSGLGILCDDFALEVHHDGSEKMRQYIRQGAEMLQRPVYAIGNDGAIRVDEKSNVTIVGNVEYFDYDNE